MATQSASIFVLDSDRTLVDRCLRNEAGAWDDLFRTHAPRVYRFCRNLTRHDADAEDLTQEVLLRVFHVLGSFESSGHSFVTWLLRVTRNLAIDRYRRTRIDRLTSSLHDIPGAFDQFHTKDSRADQKLARREASLLLNAALQKLPEDVRDAVILRDVKDMKYHEIADILQIPIGTVKSRLNRGRAELARLLRRHQDALI